MYFCIFQSLQKRLNDANSYISMLEEQLTQNVLDALNIDATQLRSGNDKTPNSDVFQKKIFVLFYVLCFFFQK